MSLIDEALKRAQAAQRPSPQAPSIWKPTPTLLPDRRPVWQRPAIWLISALLLAALAAFVSIHQARMKPASRSSAAFERRPAPPAAASTADAAPAQASGRTVTSPLTSALEPEVPARADVQPVRPARIAPTHSAAAAFAEARATPPSRTTNDHPSRALVDGKSYAGEILLASGAKIELGGIVYSEESPVALINGRVVARGDSVEGLTVAKIEPERVELEGHGVTVFLLLK
jgi:hypothetical protein